VFEDIKFEFVYHDLDDVVIYSGNFEVNSFGNLYFPLVIKFIASWGVAPSNLVDYVNVVGEYVT